ncbi:hypothetical protein ACFWU3_36285 [Streptomyces sp. NPDC058685]|uniref:hypothetical protein n=1 Tax=Streptomyces sp. NPDC058685 TaxID=3346598 RepID=UPI00364ECBD9
MEHTPETATNDLAAGWGVGCQHQAVLDQLADEDLLDLSRVMLGSAHVRLKGGELLVRAQRTGRNRAPVHRLPAMEISSSRVVSAGQ